MRDCLKKDIVRANGFWLYPRVDTPPENTIENLIWFEDEPIETALLFPTKEPTHVCVDLHAKKNLFENNTPGGRPPASYLEQKESTTRTFTKKQV